MASQNRGDRVAGRSGRRDGTLTLVGALAVCGWLGASCSRAALLEFDGSQDVGNGSGGAGEGGAGAQNATGVGQGGAGNAVGSTGTFAAVGSTGSGSGVGVTGSGSGVGSTGNGSGSGVGTGSGSGVGSTGNGSGSGVSTGSGSGVGSTGSGSGVGTGSGSGVGSTGSGSGVSTSASAGSSGATTGAGTSSSGNGAGGASSSSAEASSSSGNGAGGATGATSGVAASSSSTSGVASSSSAGSTSASSSVAASSSGSTTGGSTTGAAATGSTTSSTGTGGALELCLNGVDDDSDGDIDCADVDCDPGFECAPPVPFGWQGPVALWQGSGDEDTPSCDDSGGFVSDAAAGGSGVTAGAQTCATCECGSPVGVACQVAALGLFPQSGCSGQQGTLTIAEGVCVGYVTLNYSPASGKWVSAPAAGGACIPGDDGSSTFPPVTWTDAAVSCGDAPEGGGCGAGTCRPRPNLPFDEGLCIYKDGDVPCPPGPYANKAVYFQTADDTRDCTDCECSSPTGLSCVGTMKLYTDQSCQVDEVTLSSVGQCAAMPPDPTPPPPPYQSLRSVIYDAQSAGTGSCAASGGDPSGTVTPTDPVTFCCP